MLGFTRNSTSTFYNLLETVYKTKNYHPSHIWNADETSVCSRGNTSIKVIAKKGSKSMRRRIADSRE